MPSSLSGRVSSSHSSTPGRQLTAQEIIDLSLEVSPDILGTVEPSSRKSRRWLYAYGECERAMLGRQVAEGFAANRFVHYAENFGRPSKVNHFRLSLNGSSGVLVVRTDGFLQAEVDGLPAVCSWEDGTAYVQVPPTAAEVTLTAISVDDQVSALEIVGDLPLALGEWESATNIHGPWQRAGVRAENADVPPHLIDPPTITIIPRRVGGVYDLSAPVLGRVEIDSEIRPVVTTGESIEEARADAQLLESRHDVVQVSPGRWKTVHRLGFRYLCVRETAPTEVRVVATVPRIDGRGAFFCSDDRLNRIWATSAYTLRLCMGNLMVDGIKRDRMPWAGDHALSTLSNAYTFGTADVVRDSIVALGHPSHGYVNGISDYSLWWLVNNEIYLRYFADQQHALRHADALASFVSNLSVYTDEGGFFDPATQRDGFDDAGAGSIFIDWGVTVDPEKTYVPLQLLWHWALKSAEQSLRRANHSFADFCGSLAARVEHALRQQAWDPDSGTWAEYVGGPTSLAPHAHFLGILSGLTSPADYSPAVTALLSRRHGGTPFMTSFLLRALVQAHQSDAVIERIDELWGGMLDVGAQTFWEEFPNGGPLYEMYGRPFGKSLCHAWAAGPAALLPETVLGLRPLTDGWQTFTADPALGALSWAAAVVETPFGRVSIQADHQGSWVDVPDGATFVHSQGQWDGPTFLRIERDGTGGLVECLTTSSG